MRLFSNKRGQIRVIEAFFAAVLVLSSLAFVPVAQRNTSGANTIFSSKALNILESLDSNGLLASIIDQRNWTNLQEIFESVVPMAIWFNLTVFDENMIPINQIAISRGSPISDHVEVEEYICVSPSSTFAVYILRLQITGLD